MTVCVCHTHPLGVTTCDVLTDAPPLFNDAGSSADRPSMRLLRRLPLAAPRLAPPLLRLDRAESKACLGEGSLNINGWPLRGEVRVVSVGSEGCMSVIAPKWRPVWTHVAIHVPQPACQRAKEKDAYTVKTCVNTCGIGHVRHGDLTGTYA